MVKTRLIITDINNQKYRFNVSETGLPVISVNMQSPLTILPDDFKIQQLMRMMYYGESFTINSNSVFNSRHIVNIELEKIGNTDV